MKTSDLVNDFGFVFELAVITGTLTALEHLMRTGKIRSDVHEAYVDDLKTITAQRIQKHFRRKAEKYDIVSTDVLNKLENFADYFIFLGSHIGYHFMMEYCQSMQTALDDFRRRPRTPDNSDNQSEKPSHYPRVPQLLYYQCDLQQLFREDRKEKGYLVPRFNALLSQHFTLENKINYRKHGSEVEFLHADIIMLFRLYDHHRMVVVDVSSFLAQDVETILDIANPNDVRKRLQFTKNYLREKGTFEQLTIDTEGDFYGKELGEVIHAFSRKDKESSKAIQAGSYAYSFYRFLKIAIPQLVVDNKLEINALGLTDRGNSAIFISKVEKNIHILEICQKIFKQSKETGLDKVKKKMTEILFKNFRRTFKNSDHDKTESDNTPLKAFIATLQTVPPEDQVIHQAHFQEKWVDFPSTADDFLLNDQPLSLQEALDNQILSLREAHAKLITKALRSDNELLFLTGHPGIGKTTAVVEYLLREEILSEGFIFFYISPRIQVNNDIIEKFKVGQQDKLRDNSLIAIYSNSSLIQNNGGRPIVKYVCNTALPNELPMPPVVAGNNKIGTLTLVRDTEKQTIHKSKQNHIRSINESRMVYNRNFYQGVLNTICSAICTLRVKRDAGEEIPKNIIVTATVQSLRMTGNGNKTTEHIRKMFADARDSRTRLWDQNKLQKIACKTKNLIFMVDEVVGDQSGIQFVHELMEIVEDENLKLRNHFNLKIIVSDASIVGEDVIKQHLTEVESSPGKILHRQADTENGHSSLIMEKDRIFENSKLFKRFKATVINANSFPAKDLELTYKVGVEMAPLEADYKLSDGQQKLITEDVLNLLRDPKLDGQIIVYIQDIHRINELINKIKSEYRTLVVPSFEAFQDYLEIHSGIANKDKVLHYKDSVKIIFMTTSASRGITFPKIRYILLEIPKFQVEQNLMEIVQTVYRGRGGETEEIRALEKKTRYLIFYFHDIIYYNELKQRAARHQASIVGLLNIVLLVRTALKTRIQGYGNMGRHNLRIIPVGDKHLSSTGDSLLILISRLLTEMSREIRRSTNNQHGYDSSLKSLYEMISEVFGQTRTLIDSKNFIDVENYYGEFKQQILDNLYGLVHHPFKQAYVDGDLLIIEIKKTEEQVGIFRNLLTTVRNGRIIARLYGHAQDGKYPESLRTKLREAANILKEIIEMRDKTEQSQELHSNNKSSNQYLAVPLPVFFDNQRFKRYFSDEMSSEATALSEHRGFYNLLRAYLQLLYPITDILPLTGEYKNYPFLLFRCDSLSAIRNQHFDRHYLFSSTDLNVLNLILAQA